MWIFLRAILPIFDLWIRIIMILMTISLKKSRRSLGRIPKIWGPSIAYLIWFWTVGSGRLSPLQSWVELNARISPVARLQSLYAAVVWFCCPALDKISDERLQKCWSDLFSRLWHQISKIFIDKQQLLDEITSDPRYELLYLKRWFMCDYRENTSSPAENCHNLKKIMLFVSEIRSYHNYKPLKIVFICFKISFQLRGKSTFRK